jgi:hypothetical protein
MLDGTGEGGEHAELVCAAKTCGGEALELSQDPLAGGPRNELRVGADESRRRVVELEAEIVLQAHSAE